MIPEASVLPRPRFFWPGLMVALPLLALTVLAAAGLRSRWMARMAEARDEARRTVERVSGEAAALLADAAARARPVTLYPAPPVPPAAPSAAWREAVAASGEGGRALADPADRTDPADPADPPPAAAAVSGRFRALRDDPAPAWTDAGLPVAALAAWEVFQRGPSAENAAALVRMAVITRPSVISPVILERAAALAAQRGLVSPELSGGAAAWRASEALRAVAGRHSGKPGVSTSGGEWITDQGRLWFLRRDGEHFAIASPGPEWGRFLARAGQENSVPAWMTLSFQQDSGFPENTPDAGGDENPAAAPAPVSATATASASASASASNPRAVLPVSGPEDAAVLAESRGVIRVRALLTGPDLLYAPLRAEIAWAAGLIGAAALSASGGLWLSRRALRREQRLHALKSQFVASVSHELRAPVGSVRLMAEALASGTVKGEAARSFHHLLVQEGVRLSGLIENVLDFARMEAGRRIYQFEETDIASLLRDTAALLEPRAAPRGVTLRLDLRPLPRIPEIDARAIQQAVMNLLDNALKFSPGQSVITLSLIPGGGGGSAKDGEKSAGKNPLPPSTGPAGIRSEPAGWSITVADEGPGIPPAEHLRIFERFHRLGNELRRETQGAGIGLSLVRHIAEGHGGQATVRSLTPQGSLFILHFPWKK